VKPDSALFPRKTQKGADSFCQSVGIASWDFRF
jgi:hypothetical protein